MGKIFRAFLTTILFIFLIGCSDEEPVNPEDTLEEYIQAWESFQFANMKNSMNANSIDVLEQQEWILEERMEKVYSDLGVDQIALNYEPRNFEEEEINLDEVDELIYPVDITMSTVAGNLAYTTDVKLTKTLITNEDNDETEKWEVEWNASHIFVGLEQPTDQIDITTEQPTRGEIYDRNGEALAINGQVYQAGFIPEKIEDFDEATAALAELFSLDVQKVRDLASRYPDNPDWLAPILRFPLDDSRESALYDIKGVTWSKVDGREYPFGNSMAHVIGNIGPITAEELAENEGEGYTTTTEIGKRGLERVFEDRLRGQAGITISTLDEEGNTKDVILTKDTEHGEDITLTLDVHMQQLLTSTIGEDTGSGVVMNPTTGEVLALVSKPSYNSNLSYLGLADPAADEYEDINVLYERRFQHAYAPGSIFKPITAAIGLEEGVLDPNEALTINGKQWQPEDSSGWGDYQVTRVNDSVTEVDLFTAMTRSDNIYFARQALNIGAERFESWGEALGFGEPLPFAFPLYASSIANEGISSDIQLADTGYGQGQVETNPLHISTLYSMFLHGGNAIQPVLVNDEPIGQWWKESLISADTASTVLDMIIAVVEDPSGTAHRSNPGHTLSVAGKTGTAELKMSQEEEAGELGWYVAMDYEDKDLLVTMMLENVENLGGSGYVVDKVNEFLSKVE